MVAPEPPAGTDGTLSPRRAQGRRDPSHPAAGTRCWGHNGAGRARRRRGWAEPLPAARQLQAGGSPRRPASSRGPRPSRGPSHLPGTFAPLRFQNCFLPPSLAMAAVTSSPSPRSRPRPTPSGFTPPHSLPQERD